MMVLFIVWLCAVDAPAWHPQAGRQGAQGEGERATSVACAHKPSPVVNVQARCSWSMFASSRASLRPLWQRCGSWMRSSSVWLSRVCHHQQQHHALARCIGDGLAAAAASAPMLCSFGGLACKRACTFR